MFRPVVGLAVGCILGAVAGGVFGSAQIGSTGTPDVLGRLSLVVGAGLGAVAGAVAGGACGVIEALKGVSRVPGSLLA